MIVWSLQIIINDTFSLHVLHIQSLMIDEQYTTFPSRHSALDSAARFVYDAQTTNKYLFQSRSCLGLGAKDMSLVRWDSREALKVQMEAILSCKNTAQSYNIVFGHLEHEC